MKNFKLKNQITYGSIPILSKLLDILKYLDKNFNTKDISFNLA